MLSVSWAWTHLFNKVFLDQMEDDLFVALQLIGPILE